MSTFIQHDKTYALVYPDRSLRIFIPDQPAIVIRLTDRDALVMAEKLIATSLGKEPDIP